MKRTSHFPWVICGAVVLALATAPLAGAAAQTSNSDNRTRRSTSSRGTTGGYDSGLGLNSGRSIFGSRSKTGSSKNPATDRDKQRAEQQRDKARSRASNQPGASSAKPAPKDMKTVKGTQPPAKKAKAGAAGRAATTVEFKIQADSNANILFIEALDVAPTLHLVTQQGKRFISRVGFRNGRHSSFEAIELSLKYDPNILRPVGLDDEGLTGSLAEPALAQFDPQRGMIVYRARFREPRKDEMLVLFKLEWEAIAPTEYTRIEFLNNEFFASRVLSRDGVNILQKRSDHDEMEASERAGLLGMDLMVAPDAKTAEELAERDLPVSAVSFARQLSEGTAQGNATLALRPRQRFVRVGEDFLVDLTYTNPSGLEIDSVRIKVRFDPTVLQVVDYDDNNWITKGINIYDGAYHEDLPFDFHIRNTAYNTTGELVYEMGFASHTPIPTSGVIATIKFRAVAPAEATRITFDYDEDSKKTRTALSFLGFNLIGETGRRNTAMTDAIVCVTE